MKRMTLGIVLVFTLLSAACGGGQKVGSEKLLNFDEQKGAEALGRTQPTEAPLTIGGTPTPVATPTVTQPPKATPVIFEVDLVTDSPFYKPGNCIKIPVGITLKVTNKDYAPERAKKGRSFTDKGGTFNSGFLKPKGVWTWVFDQPASYNISDLGLNFAGAVLHVGQGSC